MKKPKGTINEGERVIKSRIKSILEDRYRSIKSLAEILEMSYSHLSDMLTNRQHMNLSHYTAILKELDLSYIALESKEDSRKELDDIKFERIPIIKSAPNLYEKFENNDFSDEYRVEYEYFAKNTLRKLKIEKPFLYQFSSQFGTPDFEPGSLLLIDREIDKKYLESEKSKYYLIRTIKNVITTAKVSLVYYEPYYILTFSDRKPIKLDRYEQIADYILGRVVRNLKIF